MIARRNFLLGLIAAPAVIRTPGLLMPVKAQPAAGFVNVTFREIAAECAARYRELIRLPLFYAECNLPDGRVLIIRPNTAGDMEVIV